MACLLIQSTEFSPHRFGLVHTDLGSIIANIWVLFISIELLQLSNTNTKV